MVDETGATSLDPYEWGRRAVAAPVQEWSAITRIENGFSMQYIVHIIFTLLVSWLYFCFTDSKPKQLKHLFIVYLNNVATKSPPETLLFWIVELIIGEVPWVLYFRLGHILTIQTSRFLVWIRFKQIWKSQTMFRNIL